MENFTAYNPTALHFGKNVLTSLPETILGYGNKALLVYGQGSIKRTGLYERMVDDLGKAGVRIFEYGGIRPNPVIEDVDAAAALGREQQVDVILAVGGGSVIDSAKIISVTTPVAHSGWEFFTGRAKASAAIPLVAVSTLAATGSEMNPFAVISNHTAGLKSAFGCQLTFPKHSFLDPQLTTSVPKNHTAYGIADLIAHCFEAWFGIGDTSLTDRIVISIVQEAFMYGPRLMENPDNYELREKIMFAATLALNGITMYGRTSGDWGVHSAGHCLSLFYDVSHGASLTIVYPAWLRLFKDRIESRISQLGSALFNAPVTADDTIDRIESFFREIGCPARLSDLQIPNVSASHIFDAMVRSKVNGANMKLKEPDYQQLITLFL